MSQWVEVQGCKPASSGVLERMAERSRGVHDDIIKWKHFPRYWPFVRGIHRSLVNSLHKGQWPGALMFSLICVWINGWVNNHEAGELRCYHAHYDVTVMVLDMNSNKHLDKSQIPFIQGLSLQRIYNLTIQILLKHVFLLCAKKFNQIN